MKITSIKYTQFVDHHKVEAQIGDRPLWFKLPKHSEIDPQDASAMVTAALVPAMLLGENLEIDASFYISRQLLAATDEIQTIYNTWNPIFKKVKIFGNEGESGSKVKRGCVFFSGGVDGAYTALQHLNEVDDLVLINGFDFTMDTETWSDLVTRNRTIAKSLGKQLLVVETNFKAFTSSFGLARYANFGSVLACIGQLLGHQKVFISAGDTYERLLSSGSHPLLNPLWSTETTQILHKGFEADRTQKVAVISCYPDVLANLWVCWKNPRYNCGDCPKCIRTAIALELNNVQSGIFKEPVTFTKMNKSVIQHEEDLAFHIHFLSAARAQKHRSLTNILKRKVFKYKLKQFLKDIMDLCLPERYTCWVKMKRDRTEELCDISVYPRYSDEWTLRSTVARVEEKKAIYQDLTVGSVYKVMMQETSRI